MEKTELNIGDVLQLNPEHKFGGMLICVTEPKVFGCQGYLISSRNFDAFKLDGIAFVRVEFADMEYVGKIQWMQRDESK